MGWKGSVTIDGVIGFKRDEEMNLDAGLTFAEYLAIQYTILLSGTCGSIRTVCDLA